MEIIEETNNWKLKVLKIEELFKIIKILQLEINASRRKKIIEKRKWIEIKNN